MSDECEVREDGVEIRCRHLTTLIEEHQGGLSEGRIIFNSSYTFTPYELWMDLRSSEQKLAIEFLLLVPGEIFLY